MASMKGYRDRIRVARREVKIASKLRNRILKITPRLPLPMPTGSDVTHDIGSLGYLRPEKIERIGVEFGLKGQSAEQLFAFAKAEAESILEYMKLLASEFQIRTADLYLWLLELARIQHALIAHIAVIDAETKREALDKAVADFEKAQEHYRTSPLRGAKSFSIKSAPPFVQKEKR